MRREKMLFLASCICAGLLLSSLPTVNAEPPADPFAEDHLSTGWQTILSETFEGTFPPGNWSVSEQGDFNLLWDDDDYRPHNGTWAAWPARGGSDGRNPVPRNDDYFNGMNTRMVYGPFSLADAEQANVSYWMNPAMQSPGDYLAFEVSTNGVNFNELSHVSGGGGTN